MSGAGLGENGPVPRRRVSLLVRRITIGDENLADLADVDLADERLLRVHDPLERERRLDGPDWAELGRTRSNSVESTVPEQHHCPHGL